MRKRDTLEQHKQSPPLRYLSFGQGGTWLRSVPALRARKGRIQSNLCRLSSLILKMILIKVCPVQRCTMETAGGMAPSSNKVPAACIWTGGSPHDCQQAWASKAPKWEWQCLLLRASQRTGSDNGNKMQTAGPGPQSSVNVSQYCD